MAVAFACLLAACSSEEHSDLKQFVKDSENLPRGRIPPVPEAKPYEPFAYQAFDLTDPFKPRKIEPPKKDAEYARLRARRASPRLVMG